MCCEPEECRNVSVCVVTRDRRECLRNCLESILCARGVAEIIVVDDASADGTSDMVSAEFPSVQLIRHATHSGHTAARNAGLSAARASFVVFLDDDAAVPDPSTLVHAAEELQDPRVGVVAIGIREYGKWLLAPAPAGGPVAVRVFLGGAFMVRRDQALELGGFRVSAALMGCWESEFALRLLDRGLWCRLSSAPVVEHLPPGSRVSAGRWVQRTANELAFKYRYTPLPWLIPSIAVGIHRLARHRGPRRSWRDALASVRLCVFELNRDRFRRLPVRVSTYKQWRMLRKPQPFPTTGA